MSWKLGVLRRVDRILLHKPKSYLHIRATLRNSEVRRLRFEEQEFIQESSEHCAVDPRSNAVLGELRLCEATRCLERLEYHKAARLLEQILPFGGGEPSTAERLVLKKKFVSKLKILRFQGAFEEAHRFAAGASFGISVLEFKVVGCALVCHHADVLSELNKPEFAVNILLTKIKELDELGPIDQPGLLRLKMSLADAHLILGSLDAASAIYSEIGAVLLSERIHPSCSKPVVLRRWTGLARIAQQTGRYSAAHGLWQRALEASRACGWAEGFTEVLVYYSMGYVEKKLEMAGSVNHIAKADELYSKTGRQYWWAGWGTSYLDLLANLIEESMGIKIQAQPRR